LVFARDGGSFSEVSLVGSSQCQAHRYFPSLAYGLPVRFNHIASDGAQLLMGVSIMWVALRSELREIAWLASVVFVLSVVGVAVTVALALA
jgi:hypothetical protein